MSLKSTGNGKLQSSRLFKSKSIHMNYFPLAFKLNKGLHRFNEHFNQSHSRFTHRH